MDEKSAKRNFQISNILIGLLMILFSIVVLMYPDVTNISVAFIFSLVLLIIGLGRVMNASSDETLSNLKAISRFISGVCALIISLVAIILLISDPAKGLELWYFLVAIALLIIGIMRVIVGLGSKKFEN